MPDVDGEPRTGLDTVRGGFEPIVMKIAARNSDELLLIGCLDGKCTYQFPPIENGDRQLTTSLPNSAPAAEMARYLASSLP